MSQISHQARKQAFWGVDCCAFWSIWFFAPKTKKTCELSLNILSDFYQIHLTKLCHLCWSTITLHASIVRPVEENKGILLLVTGENGIKAGKAHENDFHMAFIFYFISTINLCIYIHCTCSIYYIYIATVKLSFLNLPRESNQHIQLFHGGENILWLPHEYIESNVFWVIKETLDFKLFTNGNWLYSDLMVA